MMIKVIPVAAGWILVLTCLFCMSFAQAKDQHSSDQYWRSSGYRVSAVPSNQLPGYRPLKTVVVAFASDEIMQQLRARFAEISFLSTDELGPTLSVRAIDAVALGCFDPQLLDQVGEVAWVMSYSAGVEKCVAHPSIQRRDRQTNPLILTNSSGTAASVIGEHAIAMAMSMARGLHRFRDEQQKPRWSRDLLSEGNLTSTIDGKTMLVLGLGAIGKEVAKRANALGMKVLATRNRSRNGPDYVDYVGLADETIELAKQADVVVNALPLTDSTRAIVSKDFLATMKPSALYVSVGRGGTTDTEALLAALQNKQIAGAALDVTDPEPLPEDHPLWKQQNVIITPHLAGSGGGARDRTFALVIENIRRYQAGEPLLNLVDVKAGY